MREYVRTCQSCDYELRSHSQPKDTTSKSFRFRKCPKCKSENFDFGSYRGHDTKPWREKFKTLTGYDLIMPEDKLDQLISEDEEGGGLFEGNAFLQKLIENNY